MKCPNCGFDIPEGKMYCENCGAELQIVPDYDPEVDVEKEMNNTLSQISKTEFAKEYDIEFDDDPNLFSMILGKHKSGKAFYVIIGVVIVFVIVAAVYLAKSINKQNSYDYQIEQAQEKIDSNDLTGAIENLEKAYKIQPSSDILFDIADYYYTLGRINDAIYTLEEITSGEFSESERIEAYKKAISLYNSSESYEAIATLLDTCDISSILSEYADYRVCTPEFNIVEGTYEETQTVKISVDGPGKIYYTEDGSVPNTSSDVFDTPIFLEYGKYTIEAVYVNAYGVSSEVVTAKYFIDVDFVFEPEILTDSGTYETATLIEADVPVLYTLYYTTDGTDPDKNSTRYVAPIPMKEGESTYKFVAYASDGTQSSIVERHYVLNLEAQYTPAEAVSALGEFLNQIGSLIDGSHREGVNGEILLMYSAIYPIEDMGNFYFVVEYVRDEAGNTTATGNIYAVGCSDLSMYKVRTLSTGNYSLESMQ